MKMTAHQEFLDWYQPIHEPFVRFCSSKAIGWMEIEDLVQELERVATITATTLALFVKNNYSRILSIRK